MQLGIIPFVDTQPLKRRFVILSYIVNLVMQKIFNEKK